MWKNGNNGSMRDSFDKYYMPFVEIKDFNALIDNKLFFDQPVKSKQEAYEKLIEMSRNNEYTTGNLLDFSYHQNHYRVNDIDLSRQKKYEYSLTNQCYRKLEEDYGATIFLKNSKKQLKSSKKNYSKFFFRFINSDWIIQ